MLRKLNNDFSLSIPEFTSAVNEFLETRNLYEEVEKIIAKFKSYFLDDDKYNNWIKSNFENFHSSISDEIKSNCKVCKGESKAPEDMYCIEKYNATNEELILLVIEHVNFIELNRHLFKSDEQIEEFTKEILQIFNFQNGVFVFDSKLYEDTILTNVILTQREYFSKMRAKEAIAEITEIIEILETHTVVANATDRILSTRVKPQLKFFRKQLKYYNSKLLLENQTSKLYDKDPYSEYNNVFCPTMPFDFAIEHFKIFTTKNNKNGEPFLTTEQLDCFIKRAFCGVSDIKKIKINKSTREKSLIINVFYVFYNSSCKNYYDITQVRDKYIRLLTDNFEKWEFKQVKRNFSKTPIRTIYHL